MEAQTKAYKTLRLLFGLLPIAAGLDKFLNLLVDWEMYLSPSLAGLIPMSPDSFMILVGIIEIIAGILVFTRHTKIASIIVSAWLVLIALNLLLAGYYDIAVRDIALAISAYVLYILAPQQNPTQA
jgi:uncharacterized membrane protein YphA (DoxX/SURF4 family)